MDNHGLQFKPTYIPEWDAEDELLAVLSEEVIEKASPEEAKEMLRKVRIELPPRLEWYELREYIRKRSLPWELNLPPKDRLYNYYFIELPLNILLTEKYRLVRLLLSLELNPAQAVAYDLFPSDKIELKPILSGEVSLDVSKALRFVQVGDHLSQSLGLKISIPFKWYSTEIYINTSDRLSNPVEWYIRDNSIQKGFTAYLIIQAPPNEKTVINARLFFDVRKESWIERLKELVIKKVHGQSASPKTYILE